jgi:hypothetical protein
LIQVIIFFVCFADAAEASNFKREFDDDGKCCATTDDK